MEDIQTQPLGIMDPAKVDQRRLQVQIYLEDPMAFALAYDLWKLPHPPKDFHSEWLRLATQGKNLIILAPKDFGKSTIFSFILPIWLLCMDHDLRIILASDTHTQAKRRTSAVKRELEGNRALIADFGVFKPRRGDALWSDDEFIINQRENRSLPDASLRALGMGDAIEGARVDWIIPDDVCSLTNQGTPERRQKGKEWFFQPLLGCREKWTPVTGVGTRKHWGDLWGELKQSDQYHVPTEWESADFTDEQGRFRSRWPELWPAWRLKKLQDENRTAYARDKRNQPMAPEDSPFPEHWLIRAKRRGEDLVFQPARELGVTHVIQAWDVAGQSTKDKGMIKGGSFYACATIGRLPDGSVVVAEIWRSRGLTPREWVKQVAIQYDKHRPDVVVVETNAQQSFFRQHAEDMTWIPILSHNTTFNHKLMIQNREAGLNIRLDRGDYIFPSSMADRGHTHKEIENLCSELEQFGVTPRSDAAMALFMADSHLRDSKGSGKVSASLDRQERHHGPHGQEGGLPQVEGPDPWTGPNDRRPY